MRKTSFTRRILSPSSLAPSEKSLHLSTLITQWFLWLLLYAAVGVALAIYLGVDFEPLSIWVEMLMSAIAQTVGLSTSIYSFEDWIAQKPESANQQVFVLSLIVIASMCLSIFTLYLNRTHALNDSLIHIRGAELFEGNSALKRLKRLFKPEYKFSGRGLKLHPKLKIPSQRENQNALILGAVGSGKTQFLLPVVQQITDCPASKSVIFDYKGDYTEVFLSKTGVRLLAPWDKRTLEWDIKEDVRDHNDALLFAQAIIPEPTGNADPMWTQGSRTILTGCIMAAIKARPQSWTWKTLANVLSNDLDSLSKILKRYYPQGAHLLEKGSKTSSSFYQTVQTYCQPIFTLAEYYDSKGEAFSVREWLNENESSTQHIIL